MTNPNSPGQAVTSDQRLDATADPWTTRGAPVAPPVPQHTHGASLTREFLESVAAYYGWAVVQGLPPAPTIAKAVGHVSERTVHAWVRAARAAGVLAPTTQGKMTGRATTVETSLAEAVDRLVARYGGPHPAMEAICAHRWKLVDDPRHTLAQLAALDVLSSVVTAHGHDIDTAIGDLLTTLLADERPAGWDGGRW